MHLPISRKALWICSVVLLGATACSLADNKTTPKPFADAAGYLDEQASVQFLLDYRSKAWADIVPAKGKLPTPESMRKAVQTDLSILKRRSGHGAPFTIAEVSAVFPAVKKAAEVDAETPAWQKLDGVTEAYEVKISTLTLPDGTTRPHAVRAGASDARAEAAANPLPDGTREDVHYEGTMGPFRLRRSVGIRDLAELEKAEGAKLSFSDNRLTDGNGAWSTEGALFYPVSGTLLPSPTETLEWTLAPAISWNLQEQEKPGASDIDEMKFSLPFWIRWQPGGTDVGPTDNDAHYLSAEPYYQTDSGFDGEIIGARATYEYQGPFLPGLHLGTYQAIASIDKKYLAWRWRIIPQLDYSDVRKGSPYIKRKPGDDWLRIGAEVALDMRFFDEKSPLVLGISYKGMETLDGEGGYADLLRANATLWLNKFAGLTLEYQRGQTPVADQDIDLITLGMQLRY